MLTVALVPDVVADEDQLALLSYAVRLGAVDCELRTVDGNQAVVHIERTGGKVVRMTVGEEEVNFECLVTALGARLYSEQGAIWRNVSRHRLMAAILNDVAAVFGVTTKTELGACVG